MVVVEFELFFTSKICFQTNFAELTELWRILLIIQFFVYVLISQILFQPELEFSRILKTVL